MSSGEIPKIHSTRDNSIYPYPGRVVASCKCIRLGLNDFYDHSIPSIYFVAKVRDQTKKKLELLRLSLAVVVTGFSHDPPPVSRHNFTELSAISTANPITKVPLFRKEKKMYLRASNTKILAATITPFAFDSVRSNLS